MQTDVTVYVVDDDEAIRHSLELLIGAIGLQTGVFPDAGSFLEIYEPELRGCIVVDLRMPGMNGLELQEELITRDCRMPLIFLTGHGDVPAAVRALKKGATDFLVKPFNPTVLLERIQQALAADFEQHEAREKASEIAAHFATLTPREKEIMMLVTEGHSSKVIALDLGISERTVELHRSRVMKKMSARSVAELVRIASAADI